VRKNAFLQWLKGSGMFEILQQHATTCFKNQAPNNSNETTTRAATVQQQQQQEQLLWGSFTIYLGFVCGCWGRTLKEKEPLETR